MAYPRWTTWAASLLGGLLLALPFLFDPLRVLIWIALLPWLLLLSDPRAGRTFLPFFAGALLHFHLALSFLGHVHPLVLVGSASFYALTVAPFGWAYRRCRTALRVPPVVLAPVLWAGVEVIRHDLVPFPATWLNLGTSLVRSPRMAQIAEPLGVFGGTALVVLVTASIAEALRAWQEDGISAFRRSRVWGGIVVAVLAVMATLAYGEMRLRQVELREGPSVALVQGGVDQRIRNDPNNITRIFERHATLTRAAAQEGEAALIVWPESTLSVNLEGDARWWPRVQRLAREVETPLLIGAVGNDRFPEGDTGPANSAYLIEPDGRLSARWNKQILVPPAETLLWVDNWPWARRKIGDMLSRRLHFFPFLVRGEGTPLATPGSLGKQIGVLICYEDTVPDLPRDFRSAGAEVLVVLSNEAWFGRRELQQHLDMARLRAIETRLPLLRATNTGRTVFLDPTGAIQAALPDERPGVLIQRIRTTTARPAPAWMPRLFRWGALAASALLVLATYRRQPRGKRARRRKRR